MRAHRITVISGMRHSAGVSLIELMVSLTIGMFLIIVVGYAFLAGSQTFRLMEVTSRMQENTRYAFDRIAHDIRMTGFAGCSYTTFANTLNDPSAWGDLFGLSLIGFEGGVDVFPASISADVLRGDALEILRGDNANEFIVDSHNPNAASIHLTANHSIKQGEILVACDSVGRHAAVFQMSNVNNNNTISVVDHNTGNAIQPGNCTKGLGSPVPDPCSTNGTEYTLNPGTRLLRLGRVIYYIRENTAGEPALYRQRLGASAGNAVMTAEELVEGVQDMQISYGIDTSATADGAVDVYATADAVPATAPEATDEADWARVLSVRISLLLVSRNDETVTTKPQTYTFDGQTVTPADRLLRKVFTTTIAVRNRL